MTLPSRASTTQIDLKSRIQQFFRVEKVRQRLPLGQWRLHIKILGQAEYGVIDRGWLEQG